MYRALLALATCLILGTCSDLFGSTFKHIQIDGDFTDWAGVPVTYSDPSEDGASAGTDFKDVWVAHDNDYIYVRVTLYNTGNLNRSQNNVFVNGDGDDSTGFITHGTGSEMVIQAGTGYQEKNGTFNDGSAIQDLGWQLAPAGVTNQFEFRISRQAKFDDGTPVFTSTTIGIVLETETDNFATVDVAPDDGPLEYTLDPAPTAFSGTSELLSLTGTSWRFNRSGTALPGEWPNPDYDDTQAGWESGRGLFGRTPDPSVYPAPISTPFTDNTVTHYFRGKFAWGNDPAGVSLIASNFVSDGAIVYLNGAETARVRMSAGAVTSTTPAIGANPKPGQVEIIDLPPNALVVGDNVLAVEVHQSPNDTSDLVFGLSLFASDRLPAAVASPTSAQTLVIEEGSAAVFAVQARGAEPITYQWFKGTAPISGATNATYTINAVTSADAGDYLVKVSNVGAQNVASPVFTLQPKAVPVTITDATLPADVTVMEGGTASFAVAVAGSEPISFQWYKDGLALGDATNATYTLPVVLTNDAGAYTCVVSNRVTAPITSRSARLTVTADTIPPTLLSASGGGTSVLLQFSEPVDTNSLAAVAFAFTPPVAVHGTHVSTNDPSLVQLDLAALTYGTLYTVSVNGVKDRFGNPVPGGTQKQFRATIVIDGDFSDWAGMAIAYSDPQDAGPETGAQSDFKDIWITSDNDYIYLHFTLWAASDPFIFYNNIFIDADNDPSTGYAINGIGSDLLIQGGVGYQEKAGTFNAGNVNDLDWMAAPAAPATEFEARFSRQASYADPAAGGLVFTNSTIAVVLESESTGFVTKETAPDAGAGGITNTLLEFAPTDLGSMTISRSASGLTLTWSATARLQEATSLSPPAWTVVPNATSPYSISPSGKQHYYRLTTP